MTDQHADYIAPLPEICHLCAQIAGDPAGDLIHQYIGAGPYRRAICAENDDFAVIPSIGPLAPGHVLVTPKRHVRSFASLSPSECDGGAEIAAMVATALARTYGRAVHRFEHGSAICGNSIACSVEHAHLHLVPADVEVWPMIEAAGPWIELDRASLRTVVAGREYLMYEGPDQRRMAWITGDTPIASQFMRRALASALGEGSRWDWRHHPRREVIRATLSDLSSLSLGDATTVSPISVSA